jgi:hypothetical protein
MMMQSSVNDFGDKNVVERWLQWKFLPSTTPLNNKKKKKRRDEIER